MRTFIFFITSLISILLLPIEYGKGYAKGPLFQTAGSSYRLITEGETFFRAGDFENAIQSFENALERLDPEKQTNAYIDAVVRLSGAYMAIGYHDRALAVFEKAQPALASSNDRFRNTLFLNAMSDVHLALGNTEAAAHLLLKALEQARLSKNKKILSRTLNNVGNTLAAAGNYTDALLAYRQCLDALDNTREDAELKSNALINISRGLFSKDEFYPAVLAVESALKFIESQPDNYAKAADMISMGALSRDIRENLDRYLERIPSGDRITFSVKPLERDFSIFVDIPERYAMERLETDLFTLYYGLGQYRVDKKNETPVKAIVEWIQQPDNQYGLVHITGYADTVGVRKTAEGIFKSNLELAEERIGEIEQYIAHHLPGAKKMTHGALWEYGLLVGTYHDRDSADLEAQRIADQFNIDVVVEEMIFPEETNYKVYAGRFESEETAEMRSKALFGTIFPAEKTAYIGISEIQGRDGALILYKNTRGSMGPSAAALSGKQAPVNPETFFGRGAPENRKVDILVTPLVCDKSERFINYVHADQESTKDPSKILKRLVPGTRTADLVTGTVYEKDTCKHLLKIAYKAFRSGESIGRQIGDDRIRSHALGRIGHLMETEKRFFESMEKTRSAIFLAEQENLPEILYRWQWQMGRLFQQQNNTERAIQQYRNAVNTLQPIHHSLILGYRSGKDNFNTSVKPVYLELSDMLLKKADRTPDKPEREKLYLQARDTMERLKTFELEDFYLDACVVRETQKSRLDRALPDTAVVYPIQLPDRLVLLLTLPDGIKPITVPVDSAGLEQTISRFRKRLQNRLNNRFLYDAEQLYDWLIRPIESELAKNRIKTLVIAPDGALRLIPFSALYDGNVFLIEKYALATIPAVTLVDPNAIRLDDKDDASTILISGLTKAVQGFSPLPSVSGEIQDIQKMMDGKVILKDADFNQKNLAENFKETPYTIVHLATHGLFGATPADTFLLTYNNRLTMDGLEKLIELGKFRRKKVELLVMSACQTATGDERAALGLAGVAVKAGVRSALATLWFVDDEATSLAIREFYSQLKKPGISRATALQQAQQKLIRQQRYWHPLYWAPFLLIGNWM